MVGWYLAVIWTGSDCPQYWRAGWELDMLCLGSGCNLDQSGQDLFFYVDQDLAVIWLEASQDDGRIWPVFGRDIVLRSCWDLAGIWPGAGSAGSIIWAPIGSVRLVAGSISGLGRLVTGPIGGWVDWWPS